VLWRLHTVVNILHAVVNIFHAVVVNIHQAGATVEQPGGNASLPGRVSDFAVVDVTVHSIGGTGVDLRGVRSGITGSTISGIGCRGAVVHGGNATALEMGLNWARARIYLFLLSAFPIASFCRHSLSYLFVGILACAFSNSWEASPRFASMTMQLMLFGASRVDVDLLQTLSCLQATNNTISFFAQ
jgi:hypothetical protein